MPYQTLAEESQVGTERFLHYKQLVLGVLYSQTVLFVYVISWRVEGKTHVLCKQRHY